MADEESLSLDAILRDQPLKRVDYRALGSTGLRQVGGIINESSIEGLNGPRAMMLFKQMGDDASVGAVLHMQKAMIRSCKWPVQDASAEPQDQEAGDFIRSNFEDMEVPFSDVISEIASFIQYGFSLHEIMLKRRAGRSPEPWLNSRYQDGRIGLRSLPIRSQDTIQRWLFDDTGTAHTAIQLDPYGKGYCEIPLSKCLLFRTSTYKGDPQGESFCQRVFTSWYFKKSIQQSQAVGIQRDLCGIPVFRLPQAIMKKTATAAQRAEFDYWKKIGDRIRTDELASLFLPSDVDPATQKYKYDFSLVASPGTRAYNLSQIISDLRNEIFDGAMAGMIQLGQGSNQSGSFSMHSDKTELFLLSLTSYLDQICNVINLHLIPMLLDINGMQVTDYPKLTHSPLERRNFTEIVNGLVAAQGMGAQIFSGPEGEAITQRILEWAGMEPPPDEARTQLERQNMPLSMPTPQDQLLEIGHDISPRAMRMTPAEARRLAKPIYRQEIKPGQPDVKP